MNRTGNEQGSCAVAVPAEPASGKWQPIETADKDSDVIVFSAFDGEVCTAYYDGGVDQWYKSGKSPHDFDFVTGDAVFPTHWMPLPSPPETTP